MNRPLMSSTTKNVIQSRDQPDVEGEVCSTETERTFLSSNERKIEKQCGAWSCNQKTTLRVWSLCDIKSN